MINDKDATVLRYKGFGTENLCHTKSLFHNRPPIKFDERYDEVHDISKKFDVATLRIYNETI